MPTPENPFEYIRPLVPAEFHGRSDVVHQLVGTIRARSVAALVGPRRYGKTSLLAHVVDVAANVDAVDAVVVDCYGVASIGDFVVRLERALGSLEGRGRQLARRLLDASELGLSLAPGVGFKARFGSLDAPDPGAALHELLDTLAAVANDRGGLVFVLDEFQDVSAIRGLDATLRTHLQQTRNVAVLFAGSRPSMLRSMFVERARPFYGQAELLDVGPLTPDVCAEIVESGFERTRMDPGPAPELLARASDGHPQRLMFFAHLAWELAVHGATVDQELVARAIDEAHHRTAHEHPAVLDGLDRTHRDTLRAVASWGTPMSRSASRALGLAQPSAQAAVKALIDDGLIERRHGTWRVIDPLLAAWLRRLDHGSTPAPVGR